MTMIEKMNLIASNPEAAKMAEVLMQNKTEANMNGLDTMSISEITELVYTKFFAAQ